MPISTAATGDCRPARVLGRRSRSSADFCASFTLFRRDRVSLSGPPLEHCGDTVLAESFARDAPNMKFAAEINPLAHARARARGTCRGFIPHRIARCSRVATRGVTCADTFDNFRSHEWTGGDRGRIKLHAINRNLLLDFQFRPAWRINSHNMAIEISKIEEQIRWSKAEK